MCQPWKNSDFIGTSRGALACFEQQLQSSPSQQVSVME